MESGFYYDVALGGGGITDLRQSHLKRVISPTSKSLTTWSSLKEIR